jgi:hypothetical protein
MVIKMMKMSVGEVQQLLALMLKKVKLKKMKLRRGHR